MTMLLLAIWIIAGAAAWGYAMDKENAEFEERDILSLLVCSAMGPASWVLVLWAIGDIK